MIYGKFIKEGEEWNPRYRFHLADDDGTTALCGRNMRYYVCIGSTEHTAPDRHYEYTRGHALLLVCCQQCLTAYHKLDSCSAL